MTSLKQEEEEEDEEEPYFPIKHIKQNCSITIGDVQVIAPTIGKCKQACMLLLKTKEIRNYLGLNQKRKLIIPTGMG